MKPPADITEAYERISFGSLDFEELREIMESRCRCAVEIHVGVSDLDVSLQGASCRLYLRSEWDRLHVANIGVADIGRGIGTAIIDWVKEFARKKGYRALVASAGPQTDFFVKNGFVYAGWYTWVWPVPAEP
ncbi:MAG: hypothetical protein ACM3WU_04285 [Bacillota bacterium]